MTEKDIDSLLEEINKYAITVRDKPENVRVAIAKMAEKREFIADAITRDELAAKENTNEFLELYRNSFYPGRSPIYPVVSQKFPSFVSYGIRVRLAENAVTYFAPSNHGTPNFYDRHVALIFMGKGIKAGKSNGIARTVDVAQRLPPKAKLKFRLKLTGANFRFQRNKDMKKKKWIQKCDVDEKRLPIPTQIISTEEFAPLDQTDEQKQVENKLIEIASESSKKLGISRRKF